MKKEKLAQTFKKLYKIFEYLPTMQVITATLLLRIYFKKNCLYRLISQFAP
jgi:hypothetical protein